MNVGGVGGEVPHIDTLIFGCKHVWVGYAYVWIIWLHI